MIFDYCVVCGCSDAVHQHHFKPRALGGGDEEENMLTLCPTHHMQLHGYMKGLITQKNIEEAKKKAEKEKTDSVLPPPIKQQEPTVGKVISEKTYIFDSRDDVYIYRDNRSKKKWWYVRIYRGSIPGKGCYWSKSLKTTDKSKAMVMAENFYVNREHLK